MPRTALLLLLTLLPLPALAWGNKEHIELTRVAARELLADPASPPAFKAWLKQACSDPLTPETERDYFMTARVGVFPRGVDGVCYFATLPDANAILGAMLAAEERKYNTSGPYDKPVEPFGVGERALHYVDLELFRPEDIRRRYRHDLSNKPDLTALFADPDSKIDDYRDARWKKAGMLPFRLEQCYAQLVKAFRDKRLADKPGQFPRDEHAVKWAGLLAHYVQDNTNPHHATEDYRSRSYFADWRNAPDVGWDFAGRLSDDEEDDYTDLRKEFWPAFEKALAGAEDPIETDNLILATLEVASISYDALPLIGVAAQRAYGQKGTPAKPEGPTTKKFDAAAFFHTKGTFHNRETTLLEMRARQLAWGVKRTERLWRRAWDESQRPADLP
jgi:hypothetical protein